MHIKIFGVKTSEWGECDGKNKKEKEACAMQSYLPRTHKKTSDEIIDLMTRIFIYLISSFDEYDHEM